MDVHGTSEIRQGYKETDLKQVKVDKAMKSHERNLTEISSDNNTTLAKNATKATKEGDIEEKSNNRLTDFFPPGMIKELSKPEGQYS